MDKASGHVAQKRFGALTPPWGKEVVPILPAVLEQPGAAPARFFNHFPALTRLA
jgi:hypothetical protein